MSFEYLEWSDEYSWNIIKIDREHRKLLRVLKNILNFQTHEYTKEDMKEVAYTLHSYIAFLAHEEKILESIAFPDLQAHRDEHAKIAQQITLIIKNVSNLKLMQSKTKAITKQLLVNHLANEDTKVKKFLLPHHITLADEEVYDLNPHA
ncbi:MAG: hemerythrin domain-containing protein [Helicobacteraceae bacterium]|nr:hemerythrin domain-containing protein [Helicobacteraceae bacterium]